MILIPISPLRRVQLQLILGQSIIEEMQNHDEQKKMEKQGMTVNLGKKDSINRVILRAGKPAE